MPLSAGGAWWPRKQAAVPLFALPSAGPQFAEVASPHKRVLWSQGRPGEQGFRLRPAPGPAFGALRRFV